LGRDIKTATEVGLITVMCGSEVRPSVFAWRVPVLGLSGYSHQPLLDACRAIKRTGGPTDELAGLFWEGRSTPSLTCRVDVGALRTVWEGSSHGPQFGTFNTFSERARGRARQGPLTKGRFGPEMA
jgi:hypothetical protein